MQLLNKIMINGPYMFHSCMRTDRQINKQTFAILPTGSIGHLHKCSFVADLQQ